MVSEWQILKWLNRYDNGHLSLEAATLINKMQASYLSDVEKLDQLNQLSQYTPYSPDLFERAEIDLHCALFCYARGLVMDAGRYLRDAQQIYIDTLDYHRQAIAEWLLFVTFHGQTDSLTAYYWATQTQKNLRLLTQYWKSREEHHYRWYRERMLDLTTDLMENPRYVYEFLFLFHGSRLNTAAQVLRGKINELLLDGNQLEARLKMETLIKTTQTSFDSAEIAEAYTFCATTQAQLDQWDQAEQNYRIALTRYLPGGHEHTLVRWMLALCECAIPEHQTQSAVHMEESLQAMRQLAERADQQNDPNQLNWYEIAVYAMGNTLKRAAARF